MRVIHRITINSSPKIRRELAKHSVLVPADGVVTFVVDESQESWLRLKEWIATNDALDVVLTEFSAQEIANAEWLEMIPTWHHGYPQPNEDDFGFLEETYELSDYCGECGMGLKQKAPFKMKGEPKWGRSRILQLNWIFDEFFVMPGLWDSSFKPMGIDCLPVLDKKGRRLETVVQLLNEARGSVDTSALATEVDACPKCLRTKYLPVTRGPFPPLLDSPASDLARTTEYFGSGVSAHNRILISQRLARALISQQVRGVGFTPVSSSPGA